MNRTQLALAIIMLMANGVVRAEPGSFDFSVGTSTRSYPLSGAVEATGGYDLSLWGTPRGPFGGYLRPRIFAASAVTYNSVDAAFEFFPLGILGFRVGYEAVQNDANYMSYDCVQNQCMGRYSHTYLGTEATVGRGAFFARLTLRRDQWALASGARVDPAVYPSGRFIEPTAGLSLNGTGDSQNVMNLLAGMKIDENWTSLLVLSMTSSDSGEFSRTRLAAVAYKDAQAPWRAGLGAGTFESSQKPLGFTATFFASWEIQPSLALR